MTRKNLQSTFKTCVGCKRTLSGVWFLFLANSDDGLTDDCRTCRSYRKGYPTVDEAVAHETAMREIYSLSIIKLMAEYPHCTEDQLLDTHRGEFEQKCANLMHAANLSYKWKLPVWVNKVSLADYVVT